MSLLNLAAAQTIITGALAHAQAQGAKPLAVIVLDAGGHPMAFARNDGASFYRLDIARAKAQGALGMGSDTRALAERAKGNPAFFQSLSAVVGGGIAYSPGGVLIRANDWANREDTLRSYELFARWVAPRFQGSTITTHASREWASENRNGIFGPSIGAIKKAFEDAGQEAPEHIRMRLHTGKVEVK